MKDESVFTYFDKDNLEAMRLATRYNAPLLDLVTEAVRPGDRLLDFGSRL